jgi:exoribonuclease R
MLHPVGRVVGVLERNWRDYIATVPAQVSQLFNLLPTKDFLSLNINLFSLVGRGVSDLFICLLDQK